MLRPVSVSHEWGGRIRVFDHSIGIYARNPESLTAIICNDYDAPIFSVWSSGTAKSIRSHWASQSFSSNRLSRRTLVRLDIQVVTLFIYYNFPSKFYTTSFLSLLVEMLCAIYFPKLYASVLATSPSICTSCLPWRRSQPGTYLWLAPRLYSTMLHVPFWSGLL